ncbi:MAG: threonylcarbamoyl-AMP synthase [Candidatus Fermentibacteraceae bacterium]|nr:threonylcarbamoyl-AMP synthase [Candidatus Fermentibacteraceae bacterium]MBN2608130.1 threonylcarbamoyl-AMP synthase [Candidatus Fermentibacteraceae bacterium]
MSPRILSFSDDSAAPEMITEISTTILAGGVVLYPSDTVYGILCRADDPDAIDRVHLMKGIGEPRPFILLVNGLPMAETLADCRDPEVREIIRLRWPGKLTLVLPALSGCPPQVTGSDGTVALRHPADSLSEKLLEECRIPLVSTSANLSGRGTCLDFQQLPHRMIESVDLAVNGGILPLSSPSTILKLLRGRT